MSREQQAIELPTMLVWDEKHSCGLFKMNFLKEWKSNQNSTNTSLNFTLKFSFPKNIRSVKSKQEISINLSEFIHLEQKWKELKQW